MKYSVEDVYTQALRNWNPFSDLYLCRETHEVISLNVAPPRHRLEVTLSTSLAVLPTAVSAVLEAPADAGLLTLLPPGRALVEAPRRARADRVQLHLVVRNVSVFLDESCHAQHASRRGIDHRPSSALVRAVAKMIFFRRS